MIALPDMIVWHEFGHIFSYELVKKLGGKKRNIIEIKLNRKNGNPRIKTDCQDFIPIEGESPNDFQKRLKINLLENDGFYHQLIVYLMGAIFQIYKFSSKPSINCFDKMFENISESLSDNTIIGHAGVDFIQIKSLLMDYEGNLKSQQVKKFALELYYVLDEFNVFELLVPIVEKFNLKYNGQKTIVESKIEELDKIDIILNKKLIKRISERIRNLDKKNKQ